MKAKDLRNSILQAAVQGKLVPQDPDDEPASALLERIRAERTKLIAEKKVKAPKGGESVIYLGSDGSRYEKRVDAKGRESEPVCIDGEIPFDIPDSWEWARLSTFFTKMGSGSTPAGGRKVYTNEGPMIIRSQNVHNDGLRLKDVAHFDRSLFERRSTHVEVNDILLNITGASIGRCAIVCDEIGDADVNQHVLIMRPIHSCTNAFIHLAILSGLVQSQIMGSQVGATKEGLSAAKAGALLIPIPPLAEQRRIAERVSELTPLVEEYGRLEDEREALDAALPERLRKSVLQMAVQGKLVPQDPGDEPASMLLQRIRAERARLIKEKKIKAPKGGESVIYLGSDGRRYEKRADAKGRESEPACIDGEIPFEIPEGWEWVRVGELGDWKAGATPAKTKSEYHASGTVPWLLTGDLNDSVVNDIPNRITQLAVEECSVRLNPVGSILVAMYGATIGKTGILGIPATTNQACCACILFDQALQDWLLVWLKYYRPFFVRLGEGGAQPNISREKIVSRLIPIPPLAEQRRIVAQLDNLLANIA